MNGVAISAFHDDERRDIMAFWRLYYHLVWATKNREHLIQPEIEARLYAYIVGKASELGVYIYAINGWYDHIHLVVSIPPKHAVAYVVKRLKGASSHDLNHEGGLDYNFAWQRGYGALSVGERQRPIAEAYVTEQKQHHGCQTANAWLERYAEFDEGPDDVGIVPGGVPPILREQTVAYEAWGEPPF
jgi:putative transposase